ncbi:MAG: LytTR family DNA-binding domain-containing protein [Arcicella sp.]|jgi:DNA-binding LytR/AlgR family response regulator|nr:LytTR family DNA-binding domain-containing protein [Arcicella sp.]
METFLSPTEALSFLNNHTVDLIFLDLQMPNEDIEGLAFMNILDLNQHYILTTAHPQYALQSYEFNVVDYLHKPYPYERFLKAVHKAKRQIKTSNPNFPNDYLYIKFSKTLQKIKLSEICWFESARNVVRAYTEYEEISFTMTMEDLMAQLPQHLFLRIHRSFIISIEKIDLIHDDYIVINRNGEDKSICIGDTFREGLMGILEGRVLKNLSKKG